VWPLRRRVRRANTSTEGKGDAMPTWLWVLIVILVVLALFGGFGYSRR